jgi:hypothetical protein
VIFIRVVCNPNQWQKENELESSKAHQKKKPVQGGKR